MHTDTQISHLKYGQFYYDAKCEQLNSTGQVTILSGSSGVKIFYKDPVAETKSLNAIHLMSGVNHAYQVTSYPVSSCNSFKIQLLDRYGQASVVPSSMSFILKPSLSPGGIGTFYSDSNCSVPIGSGSLFISSGESYKKVYFKTLVPQSSVYMIADGHFYMGPTLAPAISNRFTFGPVGTWSQ